MMMGRRSVGQERLIYDFHLDEVVPREHLVRQIDAVLDLGGLHEELAAFYSHTGRPSIDPELMGSHAPYRLPLCDPLGAADLR